MKSMDNNFIHKENQVQHVSKNIPKGLHAWITPTNENIAPKIAWASNLVFLLGNTVCNSSP